MQRLLFSGASDNSIIMWDIGGRKGRTLLLQGHQYVQACGIADSLESKPTQPTAFACISFRFVLEVTLSHAQGLFLVLYSEITSGNVLGTRWDTKDQP